MKAIQLADHASSARFLLGRCFGTMLVLVSFSGVANGYSLTAASGSGPADLINQPNNYFSFDGDVITWKMSNDFRAEFSDPLLQNQVRLAVNEWQTATSSAERRSATRWGWTRNNGFQPVIDLRSAVTHEFGHALGLQHPDASFFNTSDDGVTPWSRNYRVNDSGNLFVAAPIGGEVLNEGNSAGFLPTQKPPKGLNGGDFWRTLSRDEIGALDYAYGRPLTFLEVGPDEEAMITIETFPGSGGSAVGVAGPDTSLFRDPGNPTAGRRILTSSIGISDNPGTPIGLIPLASAWSYTNLTGEPLSAISVRSEGTSNGEPMDVFSSGTHRFGDYEQANTVLLHEFENRGHRFINPVGGSVPNGSTVDFGLTLDAWDWTAERATAITTNGNPIGLPLISLHGWVDGDFEFAEGDGIEQAGDGDIHGISSTSGKFNLSAQGFRVVAGDQPGTLSELAFASVAELGLTLSDLTPQTLALIETSGDLVRIPLQPVDMQAGDDLLIVLEGLVDDLPQELQQSGAFRLANDDRWAQSLAAGEVLVYGRFSSAEGELSAFSLINSAPVVGTVPEPANLALVSIATLVAATLRRKR